MGKMNQVRFFQVKPAIYYGINSISRLYEHNFKKVCIVTDEGMVKFGILKMVTDILDSKGVAYHVFSEVQPDPTMEIVESGLKHMLLERPDTIIALGGGSAIDAAKAIIYYCYNMQKLIVDEGSIKRPYFIAMPTTAGTGSEVTEYAVITDTQHNTKIPLTDDMMMPDEAILEPKLIESVPANATAATGMDVLTHAIESYISSQNNPFSRSYSAKAAELVFRDLYESYINGLNLEAKASMQIASCMAGIAFNSAGLGINHSIAHAIGAQWHLPHGLSNAIVMPYVIHFNGTNPDSERLYGKLLDAISLNREEYGTATETLAHKVQDLGGKMNIARSLKEMDIAENDYLEARETMVKKALKDMCTKTNPIIPTYEQMESLFDKVYYGQ